MATIKVGGKDYEIPVFTLGQLRRGLLEKLREHDRLAKEEKVFDAMALRGEVIFETLKRKYPEIEEAEVYDAIDMNNQGVIWLALLGMSGFKPGEVEAATEAKAGT